MLKKISGIAAAAMLCAGCLAAPALADETTAQHHGYQTHSSLQGVFAPKSCGAVKGAWGAPSIIPAENGETWTASGDQIYAYWFHVVDADGNMIFGGVPGDESQKGSVTHEIADKAFKDYIRNFNWNKVGFAWAYQESPIAAEIEKNYTENINGWDMNVYEGSLTQRDTKVPFVAYMVDDKDTASWCVVIANKEDMNPSKLRESARMAAQSYRGGKEYVKATGVPFLY